MLVPFRDPRTAAPWSGLCNTEIHVALSSQLLQGVNHVRAADTTSFISLGEYQAVPRSSYVHDHAT